MEESLRSVPVVSSARSANKLVPAACVMRKPILEDYLFYKELRQVLPAERVDEILANEAVLPLSAALELGESVLDGSGAFIADTEEKKDSPSAPKILIVMGIIRTSAAAVEMLVSRVSV